MVGERTRRGRAGAPTLSRSFRQTIQEGSRRRRHAFRKAIRRERSRLVKSRGQWRLGSSLRNRYFLAKYRPGGFLRRRSTLAVGTLLLGLTVAAAGCASSGSQTPTEASQGSAQAAAPATTPAPGSAQAASTTPSASSPTMTPTDRLVLIGRDFRLARTRLDAASGLRSPRPRRSQGPSG